MTISTTTSSVTIGGNGSTLVFSFPFVADNPSTMEVYYTDASGITTLLSPSVYTLFINAPATGQLWGVGGTVTYPNTGSPPTPIPVGTFITISRDVPYTQTVSIANQGAFYPQVIEQGLDLLELQIQQIQDSNPPFGGANPTATAGPTAINGSAPTFLRSDGAPAVQIGSSTQKGLLQVDGTTITASAGVISTVTHGANPTATAGPVAVNGSATTFMRSDGAPAVQKGTNSQFGIVEVDGTTITSASGVISAAGVGANPTALAGPTAVNGTAVTFLRSDGAPAVQKASSSQFGIVEVDGTTILASSGVISASPSASTGNLTGNNRFINGDMRIDQRNSGNSQTFTAGANVVYTVDRWAAQCSGANITGQQITGAAPFQYAYRFSGATGCTGTAFEQRIESRNSGDLLNRAVACQAQIASSNVTTVTWTAYSPTATDNWSAATTITSGTLTINSTPTTYFFTFNAGANATKGLAVVFTTGALTGGQTLQYGGAQLEVGSTSTPYQTNTISNSLNDCERYFQLPISGANIPTGSGYAISTTQALINYVLAPSMRTSPSAGTSGTLEWTDGIGGNAVSITAISGSANYINILATDGAAGLITRQPVALFGAPGVLSFSAEL